MQKNDLVVRSGRLRHLVAMAALVGLAVAAAACSSSGGGSGTYYEFRIHSSAMTQAQITASIAAGPDAL